MDRTNELLNSGVLWNNNMFVYVTEYLTTRLYDRAFLFQSQLITN